LNLPDPPLFGRQPYGHAIFELDRNTRDDRLDNFHPQASSQWDGLRHVRYAQHGFWGGRQEERINGEAASELGIEQFAEHGVAGRGVLLDVERWARNSGRNLAADEDVRIGVADLEATLSAQGVALETGDILLLRTGWLAWYRKLDKAGRERAKSHLATPGLESGPEMAEWIWERHIAVFAGDNPALEHIPGSRDEGYLHRRVLPALGLAIGEMWDFDALAEACADDGIYEFFVAGVPLNLPGGVGSPANAIAIR
jgi:kynurenine formamidase